MNAKRNFSHSLFVYSQINRRIINRISAQNNERFDRAAVNFLNELAKLINLRDIGIRLKRFRISYRRADISKCGVHRVSERVNNRRLIYTDNDN